MGYWPTIDTYPASTPVGIIRLAHADSGTYTMLVDRIHLCGVIEVASPATLDAIHYEVTSAGDGSAVLRVGTAPITDAGVVVGETLTEHGSGDGTTTGVATIGGSIGYALSRGRYAVLAVTNGESATAPTFRGGPPVIPNIVIGNATLAVRSYTGPASGTGHTGAMPATVPTMLNAAAGVPILGVTLS